LSANEHRTRGRWTFKLGIAVIKSAGIIAAENGKLSPIRAIVTSLDEHLVIVSRFTEEVDPVKG
jgi:hypothetical protein